jgi:hypothetical protein
MYERGYGTRFQNFRHRFPHREGYYDQYVNPPPPPGYGNYGPPPGYVDRDGHHTHEDRTPRDGYHDADHGSESHQIHDLFDSAGNESAPRRRRRLW